MARQVAVRERTEVAHKRPVAELVRTTKVLLEKIEQAQGKEDQHEERRQQEQKRKDDLIITLGQTLVELKEHKPAGITFREYLTKKGIKLGKSRAYEVMAIADGRTSVSEVRADTRKKVSRHRSSVTNSGNGQSREVATVPQKGRDRLRVSDPPFRNGGSDQDNDRSPPLTPRQHQSQELLDLKARMSPREHHLGELHRISWKLTNYVSKHCSEIIEWANTRNLDEDIKEALNDLLRDTANLLWQTQQTLDGR